ncbi:hypothetical protein [Lignipirellula cremea]|uniref:Uncharacterized protein n=1 Tax=Lignipirellula cremea TaxID=2528010 RepID=A0A518DSU9_9BACT|nr:hypothetical protein [Lignipirellula cremea]QDU94909.1 hypothetical protein Pla8534_27170 [Lignipirellula cremea]
MQYVIFVQENPKSEDQSLYVGPVPPENAAYLRRLKAELKPLSEEDYIQGPLAILHTMARYSYVLDGQDLYWCVEWEPGLLVIRFSPGQEMTWTAIRSPVPDFGGREPSDADLEEYDEQADNLQYDLVFDAWDAEIDEELREGGGFAPAPDDVQTRFENAVARANELCEIKEERVGNDYDAWFDRCLNNLERWCGDGLRLR